jgi:hypothetical protein
MKTPRWALDPVIVDYIPKVQEFLEKVGHHGANSVEHWAGLVRNGPLQYHGGFFTCPVLSAEGCEHFLYLADDEARSFEPNTDEQPEYQIPELVLTGGYMASAMELAEEVLWPLFHIMYGAAPNHFSSIQLARYKSGVGTGWHHDTDSEASAVISLAPGRHTGGGTALRPAGALAPAVTLPPLPQGSALLFNGRTTLHRGLPTTTGERNLLVYWMMHNEVTKP